VAAKDSKEAKGADKAPKAEEKKKPAAEAGAKAEGGEGKKAGGKSRKPGAGTGNVPIAAEGETKISPAGGEPRLVKTYREKAIPALMKEFQFKNPMEVPRLVKVVVNCAVKEAVANPKVLDSAIEDFMWIMGQKPILTRAKKSVATFKIREGNALGVAVTLRRARMWEFLDRLMNVALPRVRDFKGVNPRGFDGRGNFSMGLKEQIIFPEINYDKIDSIRGMTVTIVTTAKKNEHARSLLTEIGMPFRK
jgi:large subunit ribosomal protein L5